MEYPQPTLPPKRRSLGRYLFEFVRTLLLVLAIYTFVNLAIPRYAVAGESMQPIFDGSGQERVIVSRIDYILGDPQRGDIVVIDNPDNGDVPYIKRIIGLPGERVHMENGLVFINDSALDEPYVAELCSRSNCTDRDWVLGADQYFVLGDNRNASRDSVAFGPIERSTIIGRAWIRYWPPEGWGIFEHFDYVGLME